MMKNRVFSSQLLGFNPAEPSLYAEKVNNIFLPNAENCLID